MSSSELLLGVQAQFAERCEEARRQLGQRLFSDALQRALEADPARFLAHDEPLVVAAAEARQAVLLLLHAATPAQPERLDEVRLRVEAWLKEQCAQFELRVGAKMLGMHTRLSAMQQQVEACALVQGKLDDLRKRVEISEEVVAEAARTSEKRVSDAIARTLSKHEARLQTLLQNEVEQAHCESRTATQEVLDKCSEDVQRRLHQSELASAKLMSAFETKVAELTVSAHAHDVSRVESQLLLARIEEVGERLTALEEGVQQARGRQAARSGTVGVLTRDDVWAMRLAGITKFDGLRLSHLDLTNFDLAYCTFKSAHLEHTKLSEANLAYTDFTSAQMSGAVIKGADLRCAALTHVDLARADCSRVCFWHADLSHARLAGGKFSKANFSKAVLRGIDFTGADMSHGCFDEALFAGESKLLDACFKHAHFSAATFLSVEGAVTLHGGNFEGAHFVDLDFAYHDQKEVPQCQFLGADFSAANFTRVGFDDRCVNLTIAGLSKAGANLQDCWEKITRSDLISSDEEMSA